jgi:hypothetical protein
MCAGFVAAIMHEQNIPSVSGGTLSKGISSWLRAGYFEKKNACPTGISFLFPLYPWVYQGVPKISAPFLGHYPTQIAAS